MDQLVYAILTIDKVNTAGGRALGLEVLNQVYGPTHHTPSA